MQRLMSCAVLMALCLLGVTSAGRLQPTPQKTARRARSAASNAPLALQVQANAAGVPAIASQVHPTVINIQGAQGTSHPTQLLVLLLSPGAPATSSQCQVPASPAAAANVGGTYQGEIPAQFTIPATSAGVRLDTVPAPFSLPQHSAGGHIGGIPAPFSLPPSTGGNVVHTAAPSTSDDSSRGSHLVHDTQTAQPPKTHPSYTLTQNERRARNAPTFPPVEDSQLLLQQFREQMPLTPSLPPVVTEPLSSIIDDKVVELAILPETFGEAHGQIDGGETERCNRACRQRSRVAQEESSPPLPRFERSMMLKAVLTVHKADYSEPYTVWWDAASGAARIDYHEGTASSYRMMRLDGRVQSVQMVVDRTGEADVRRCTVAEPRRGSLAMRALPVLPDLAGFNFAGYVEVAAGDGRVERWRQTVRGAGVGREELTYRHELLVLRAPDNFTTSPLRYAVAVDSSILGENCDTYAHRFLHIETKSHDPAMFRINLGDACEQIVTTDQMDLVEPLREFTLLRGAKKHDIAFQEYKTSYARRYADEIEEAVRKNVLTQSTRFSSSGNRKGASFELEVNFLGDRLRVERNKLLGVENMDIIGGESFPHSDEELQGLRGRLPTSFDWRPRGGVTSVRYQGTCSSCWAFSVVGAVEGALFVKTGRLVPLSEQTLVDCGAPYGTNGCKPTWPRGAYNYVQAEGLPALDEYPNYVAKVQQCSADRVPAVTRISGHVNVTSRNVVALKVAIQKHGPTVVLVDAETPSFISYKKGYYHDQKCKKNQSNHAMLAVGWSVHRGETYFILKNWWSEGWGDEGYIRVRGSTNTCGVLRIPSYPILRRSDVLRIPASAPAAVTPPAPAAT